MQDCPPGEEQETLAALQIVDGMEYPPAFREAVLHACREAGQLPTYASSIKWRIAFLIRHGALNGEGNDANPFEGGMLVNALQGPQHEAAQAHLEHVQLLQAMIQQIAEQEVCSSNLNALLRKNVNSSMQRAAILLERQLFTS
jgi:hypothetical protein